MCIRDRSKAVSINGSETVTQSVASGKAIIWRYKTSKTDGSFSGSYTTLSASDTVSCATLLLLVHKVVVLVAQQI